MNINITNRIPVPAIMINHVGPYNEISAVFDQLGKWIEANQIPVQQWIGIYLDNPEHVPANQLRSCACATLPMGYQLTASGIPGRVGNIPGGTFATTTFTGPYDQLEAIWSEFTQRIELELGKSIRDDIPAFEIYVNDPSTTPPDQLVTELFMPVR